MAGIIGFVISNGLDHIIVHILTHDDTRIATTLEAMADTVGSVRAGIVVSSGSANAFGAMLLAIGLRMTFESTFQRVTAHVMVVVAFIALASNLLGSHLHTAPLDALLGIATLLVAIWFVILGVGIVRE